jgi:hypothetical protein
MDANGEETKQDGQDVNGGEGDTLGCRLSALRSSGWFYPIHPLYAVSTCLSYLRSFAFIRG